MYPNDLTFYNHTGSEEVFFDALKKQLPEHVSIFFSVAWYETLNGKRNNSEADFIIFDPTFGYLTIEVKGGKQIIKDGDQWLLIEGDNTDLNTSGKYKNRQLKKSPFKQAENSMWFIYNYYQEQYNEIFPGTYGYACAFPLYNIETDFAPEAPKELIIDFRDMNQLATRISLLFHYWNSMRKSFVFIPLDVRKKFVNMIHRRVAVAEVLGAKIIKQEAKINLINRIQDNHLEFISNYKKATIIGSAGTGKTYLAIKKAIKMHLFDKKVLFLCHNSLLKNFISNRLNFYDNIDVYTFWGLIKKTLSDRAFTQLAEGNPNLNGVFDAIDITQAIDKYDAIIVDEAQDFSEEWALCTNLFLSESSDACMYVFCDEDQKIFTRDFGNTFVLEQSPFLLFENLRNTKEIHQWAVKATGLGSNSRSSVMHGSNPQVFSYTRAKEARSKLNSLLNNLVFEEKVQLSSITLLANRTLTNSFLKGNIEIGPFVIEANSNSYMDSEDDILRYYTIQRFKGLESDIVIYLHHKHGYDAKTDNSINYVAYTRAKYFLYIIEYQEKY